MITDNIGGRKFLVGIMLLVVGVALEIFSPRGLTSTMATFLVGLGVSYFAANVTSKHVTGSGDAEGETSNPTIATPSAPIDAVAVADAVSKDLKPILQGIGNQNGVIATTVGEVAKGTTYLVGYVQQVQGINRS